MTARDRLRVGGERAQLLLVGAVAIGLILLGLVVVYNTILFTSTQEPTQSLDDAADTRVLRQQVVNDTRRAVRAIHQDTGLNCSSPDPSKIDKIEMYINQNVSNLSDGLTYSKASTGVRYVGIRSPNTSCIGSGPGSDNATVNFTLVVRTPESSYNASVSKVYNTSVGFPGGNGSSSNSNSSSTSGSPSLSSSNINDMGMGDYQVNYTVDDPSGNFSEVKVTLIKIKNNMIQETEGSSLESDSLMLSSNGNGDGKDFKIKIEVIDNTGTVVDSKNVTDTADNNDP